MQSLLRLFILAFIFALIWSVWFYLFTSNGADVIIRGVLDKQILAKEGLYTGIEGSVKDGIILTNVELKDLKYFPPGNILRVQKIYFKISSWNNKNFFIHVENARIKLSHSDIILFEGKYQHPQKILSANIYSPILDVEELMTLFPNPPKQKLRGEINETDLYIDGTLSRMRVKGSFLAKEVSGKDFQLSDGPVGVNVSLEEKNGGYQAAGLLTLTGGGVTVHGREFKLSESKFLWAGDVENPSFNITATTKIQQTKVDVTLQGTRSNPMLKLESDPPMSSDKILLILLTGTKWENLEAAWQRKAISLDVVRDVVDYYLFGGEGQVLADKMGITDIKLLWEENSKGFGIKKAVTDNLSVNYELKKNQTDHVVQTEQKIGGEVRINPSVSVAVDRQFQKEDAVGQVDKPTKTDDSLYLKYKTNF